MNTIANRETLVMQQAEARGKKESRAGQRRNLPRALWRKGQHRCYALAALLPRIIEIVGVVLPRAALQGRTDKRLAFLVDGVP